METLHTGSATRLPSDAVRRTYVHNVYVQISIAPQNVLSSDLVLSTGNCCSIVPVAICRSCRRTYSAVSSIALISKPPAILNLAVPPLVSWATVGTSCAYGGRTPLRKFDQYTLYHSTTRGFFVVFGLRLPRFLFHGHTASIH